MNFDFQALAVIFIGLAIGAFVKGLTGTGLPMVAVPFMAIYLGAEHAIVVLQLSNIVSNTWLIWAHRKKIGDANPRADLFLPAAVMVISGVWFLNLVDDSTVILLLAGSLGAFLLLLWAKPNFRLTGRADKIVTPIASVVGGFIQGATGVSGAVFTPLIYSYRLNKESFVLYNGILYGLFNFFSVGTIWWLGMFTTTRLIEGLLALIPLVIFQYLGMKMTFKVSLKTFNIVVVAVLVAMESQLIWHILFG